MPTGYTYKVAEGKQTEFSDFALSCARAFGALVTMRDDPADAPIPDEIAPSTYSAQRLEESKARLAELQSMTPDEIAKAAQYDFATKTAAADKFDATQAAEDARLEAMAAKVRAWSPPTEEHAPMKAFMLDQLRISKHGDYRSSRPAKLTPNEWLEGEIASARKDIAYHTREQAAEDERARGRTEWLKSLRASL